MSDPYSTRTRYTICSLEVMTERPGPNRVHERAAFVAEHEDLLKRCVSALTKERKHYLRELVAKARVHFGYSENTISQDIVRPLVRAYSKYVAQQKPTRSAS
jgi:hypothetical protein